MRLRPRAGPPLARSIVLSALLVATVSACSVISGLSELERADACLGCGDRDATADGAGAGARDGGAGKPPVAGDAGAPTLPASDAGVLPRASVTCGSSSCTQGEDGCCLDVDAGTATCGARLACRAPKSFLRCENRRGCTFELGRPAFCCLSYGGDDNLVASCATACRTPVVVTLCDPRDPDGCPDGGACILNNYDLPGYSLCR